MNATFESQSSSFINLRGGAALNVRNPKSFKFTDGCIYKCESKGICIKLDNIADKLLKHIIVKDNRIIQIIGTALLIEGSGESDYLPYTIDIADNKV